MLSIVDFVSRMYFMDEFMFLVVCIYGVCNVRIVKEFCMIVFCGFLLVLMNIKFYIRSIIGIDAYSISAYINYRAVKYFIVSFMDLSFVCVLFDMY